MANEEHLAILSKGKDDWNEWREANPEVTPDLRDAKLQNGIFEFINLRRAVLEGADLREANIWESDFSDANLRRANLSAATIDSTGFERADLRGANLDRAEFTNSGFYRAKLGGATFYAVTLRDVYMAGADFRPASPHNVSPQMVLPLPVVESSMQETFFGNVDLTDAEGLETVIHEGPSTIGIDTIYRSKGNIPDSFLRGAGVPEPFIVEMKALVAAMEPIQFYSCFISYSTKDQEFAERLYADLRSQSVRCWFAPHEVHGGRKLHEQIDEAIRVHEKVLLILSESSMASEWVKTEIAKARSREVREKKQVMFPVRLVPFEAIRDWECFDADAGKDSAREIREYFIPDFSEWKEHDKYKKAFERLIGDLKTAATDK
jgi:hypothetical protein